MPPRQRAPPYLYYAISKLLADEMVENFKRIGREFGMVGNAKEQMQGYARWVYVGGLTCGENVIDYSKDTGRGAAMKTQMTVCLQSQCDHSVYCNALNYLATTMRCNMSKVLNMAAGAQKKANTAASNNETPGDDVEIAAAVSASLKAYIFTRYKRRGRKPNKQRR